MTSVTDGAEARAPDGGAPRRRRHTARWVAGGVVVVLVVVAIVAATRPSSQATSVAEPADRARGPRRCRHATSPVGGSRWPTTAAISSWSTSSPAGARPARPRSPTWSSFAFEQHAGAGQCRHALGRHRRLDGGRPPVPRRVGHHLAGRPRPRRSVRQRVRRRVAPDDLPRRPGGHGGRRLRRPGDATASSTRCWRRRDVPDRRTLEERAASRAPRRVACPQRRLGGGAGGGRRRSHSASAAASGARRPRRSPSARRRSRARSSARAARTSRSPSPRPPTAIAARHQISGHAGPGESDAQIEQSFVARYGPSILLVPPASGWAALVWFAPAGGGGRWRSARSGCCSGGASARSPVAGGTVVSAARPTGTTADAQPRRGPVERGPPVAPRGPARLPRPFAGRPSSRSSTPATSSRGDYDALVARDEGRLVGGARPSCSSSTATRLPRPSRHRPPRPTGGPGQARRRRVWLARRGHGRADRRHHPARRPPRRAAAARATRDGEHHPEPRPGGPDPARRGLGTGRRRDPVVVVGGPRRLPPGPLGRSQPAPGPGRDRLVGVGGRVLRRRLEPRDRRQGAGRSGRSRSSATTTRPTCSWARSS